MKHPSMRVRLMVGTGLAVSVVLLVSLVIIYQSVSRMLRKEVRLQLLNSASLLMKSSELEPGGVVYEWHEALESDDTTGVLGLFQFWDQNSGTTAGSPALGGESIERFHGELNQPVLKPITLPDGRPAMAVGVLHLPFLDGEGLEEMKRLGKVLQPQDFPQVLVCARETRSLDQKLGRFRGHLIRAGAATLIAIWVSVGWITRRTLRPIDELAERLDRRSREDEGPVPPIPDGMPVELTALAGAFNRTLERVEAARERERRFALHAAHELRTPISGLQAILEQAVSRPRDADELTKRIESALGVASGMRGTVHTLMRLARIRGGLEQGVSEPFDPALAVRETLDEAKERFEDRGIELASSIPDGAHALDGDPELFRLVVGTLVDNMVRHAPSGSEARVSADEGASGFRVVMTNRADGLAPEELPRLFEPFQRGEASVGHEGSGLGLSLAREVVLAMGGAIDLRLRDEDLFEVEVNFSR
ncbi:hypothetical protein HAHE_20130 [Haloferula helveola]|uniref:histidine kinase n=1 Tax=Haloferula helveola TaxID=490095 RepID=A0ABN6H384_9BACT|nr:hypothetical protein HAHE_20130 [Haloferula helveola]